MKKFGLVLFSLVLVISCSKLEQEKKDRREMRKNYNNFIFSVDELNQEGLEVSAAFPGIPLKRYRKHVKSLLVNYIDTIKNGQIEFDDTGVVLTRFLGLTFHKYVIKKMDIDRQAGIAKIRVSVHFGYENNLKASQPEEGTTYYIPTEPWGHVNTVVIGQVNLVPRRDLLYVEYDVVLEATEYDGFWRVRQTVVDESSIQYRDSDETFQ